MSSLTHALKYAERGLLCLAVNRDKRPSTENGLYDATCDGVDLIEMFERYPDANVAIRTGRESGVFVLDVDPRNGGTETMETWERAHGRLPMETVVFTGGDDRGRHLYFDWPVGVDEIKSSGGNGPDPRFGPGVELKATGRYVVAPDSLHRSGRRYRWGSAGIPDEFEPVPPPLLEVLIPKTTSALALPAPNRQLHLPPAYVMRTIRGAYADVAKAEVGTRNNALFRSACQYGRLVDAGHLAAQVAAAALEEAAATCGLSTREAQRTIKSGLTTGREN